MEDPRIKILRSLIREVIELQSNATRLLATMNEQLDNAIAIAEDRPERRKKPRP